MDSDTVTVRRLLSGLVGAALLVGIAGLVYFAVAPVPATPADTAFYVANESGTAAGYPTNPNVSENVSVVVGIHNNEHQRTSYVFEVRTVNQRYAQRSVTLADGERWERPVALRFEESGEKRVRLYLYRGDQVGDVPYRDLYLNFDVSVG